MEPPLRSLARTYVLDFACRTSLECRGMESPVLASTLRANIYKMLDHVIETGQPIEVRRGDRAVRIVPVEKPSRLRKLPRRKVIRGDAEELVSLDWSKNWKPGRL